MYEQKWEDSYKETPVPANAGSGDSLFIIPDFYTHLDFTRIKGIT